MKKPIGIVILNYETYEESIHCVDSIKLHSLNYSQIVIVDNASINDSYAVLQKYYAKDDSVHVIQTETNLGFARGNNKGILYLRKKGIDCVLLLNSDTVILKDDYLVEMLKSCSENTGVVGSKIKLMHGMEQGGELEDLSLPYLIYNFLKSICRHYYIYFPVTYQRAVLKSLRVHGCSILLTPAFFDKYECLWPYTFLYGEEIILSIMMEKAKLKTKIADTWIFHKESKSTERYWTRYSRKREWMETKSRIQQIMVKVLPFYVIRGIIRRCTYESR